MKKILLLIAVMLFVGCESNTAPTYEYPTDLPEYITDTTYVMSYDTIKISDTVTVVDHQVKITYDTIYIRDTLNIYDTLNWIDTVEKVVDELTPNDTMHTTNWTVVYQYVNSGKILLRRYTAGDYNDLVEEAEYRAIHRHGVTKLWNSTDACGKFLYEETNYSMSQREGWSTIHTCTTDGTIFLSNVSRYENDQLKEKTMYDRDGTIIYQQ